MIVGAGQQICLSLFDPFFSFMPLTLGAVPVAATVIADVHRTAITTGVHMPAQGSGAALGEGTKGLLLMYVEL
jgi:hypothetical protein